jgi:hypothetical protein
MTDPHDDPELRLPQALERDLRASFAARVPVPESIGATLRTAARRRPRLVPVRPLLLSAAAAALVAVSVLLVQGRAPLAREDFDRNGRVDVLDAFRLARALERGEVVPPQFDLDGDGRIDRRDVDLVAARAVRIHG